jgi:hypothetical protein
MIQAERQEPRHLDGGPSATPVKQAPTTGPRYLFIVSRMHPDLFEYLREHFVDAPEVQVILDRRNGQRRQSSMLVMPERRRADRRTRPEIDARLASESHVFLTLT